MGVSVNVYTWPQIVLAPRAKVTFIHSLVDDDGVSMIEPHRWYWMSAVPEFVGVEADESVPAASVEIVAQRPFRDRQAKAGLNNTNWLATWYNPNDDVSVTFSPRMLEAPDQ